MKHVALCLFAALLLAAAPAAPADAQDYRFGVPQLQMLVTVKPDASVHIAYDITFHNQPGAHAIDIVDIGTPHKGYNLGNVRASINNDSLPEVRPSTVVSPGFEVHLGRHTIMPGQTGTLHVEFDMPDMVFQDATKADLASLRITPTWFGDPYLVGNTHLQIAVQLPKSVEPNEVLHQGTNFASKARSDVGALVGWDWPTTRLTKGHLVGLSFPQRDMVRVVTVTKLDLLLKWFRESPQARLIAGLVSLAMFAMVFFRFSGGTGLSVFFILAVGLGILFFFSPGCHLLSLPLLAVLIGVNEWYLAHRKLRYMPPLAHIEGGGIKRGLTAPEAAVLLELPLAKVLSLVVFGLLKKGVLRQVQADPLVVAIDEAFQTPADQPHLSEDDRAKFYRQAAHNKGVVVHNYEHPFLFLIRNNPGQPLRDVNFSLPVKQLISATAARMAGFHLRQTQDYYRSIVSRAVAQAKTIGDIPQRQQTIDRNFEWILMDDDFPTVFTSGHPYQPMWTRGSSGPASAAPAHAPAPAEIPGRTTFGDVSSSFAGWAENTMGNLASAISPAMLSVDKPGGGFIDLSGADRVTGEFFEALGKAMASAGDGGGGGGGGGGCACACAGCACACACAGGGR